jgi:uncharacterized protein (DUF1015 family)
MKVSLPLIHSFPNINEIKALADADLITSKSTFIEPKFRSGIVIYEL